MTRTATKSDLDRPRALIYTRVSQDRSGQGRSPAEQEAESRGVCEREGFHLVRVVTDSLGASRHSRGQRTGWQEAIAAIEAGEVDVLVTWEASRATRDLEDYVKLCKACERHGVVWHYSGTSYDFDSGEDRFRSGLDVLLAMHESDKTSARVRRAVEAQAVAGRPHGRLLYGFARTYEGTGERAKVKSQVPDPVEAAVVTRIFDEFLDGRSSTAIAKRLNAEGITTRRGKPWGQHHIARMLANPAYAGLRVHQGEVIGAATWEGLVDESTWSAVQARLAERRATQTRHVMRPRLLSGIARCGVCGGKMRYLAYARRNRQTYACLKGCVSRTAAHLEAYVVEVVLEELAGRRDAVLAGENVAATEEVGRAFARLEKLRTDLAELVEEFDAERLSAAGYARAEGRLLSKIADAEREVSRLSAPVNIDVPEGDLQRWWIDELDDQRRREILRALVTVVVRPYPKNRRSQWDPDFVEVVPL